MNKKLSRDERQDLAIDKWKQSQGRGTILAATGFGKTRIALKTIRRLRALKPELTVTVVVPSDYLKIQWNRELEHFKLENVDVQIINSAIKNEQQCDLLIVDEVHLAMADTFSKVFIQIQYKALLCLTGTIDRLDGKQILLRRYAPICDTVTLADAVANGWVAEFKQYKVLIDVDLTEYNQYNAGFMHHFSWFNYEFQTAMDCATDYLARARYAKLRKEDVKNVTIHAMGFLRNMKARKSFVYDHPKKIEICNKILQAREDKKIITFTKNIDHAKQICCGDIYHGKLSKKKKAQVMDAFNLALEGTLNSCQALNVGADVQGVNTIIIISGDSSSITKQQRIGRGIRKEDEKVAEIWQLILRGTVDESWYKKASVTLKTSTVDEKQLDQLLKEGEYEPTEVEKLLFKFE